MDWNERIGWLMLGCLIGFVLGYIVRTLRDIKEELDEVDETVHNVQKCLDEKDLHVQPPKPDPAPPPRTRNESGVVRHPIVMDVALLLVVVLTVWAAFASQRASNDIQDTQRRLTRVTFCNQQYLAKTIAALNERTEFTIAQSRANVKLQRSQAGFLKIVLQKPTPPAQTRAEALQEYFDSLQAFITVNTEAADKVTENPYPTTDELSSCLDLVQAPNE